MNKHKTYIEEAITVAGGLSQFARLHGVSPATANHWRHRGVPVARAWSVAKAIGLSPEDICPSWPVPAEVTQTLRNPTATANSPNRLSQTGAV